MQKLYENFHILYFQKRMVSAETIRVITVFVNLILHDDDMSSYDVN